MMVTISHSVPPQQKIISRSKRDLEFICKQLIRFMRMTPEQSIAYFKKNQSDALCSIQHPDGRGHIICGSLAWERFGDLADLVIAFEPSLAGRIDRERLTKDVISVFVKRVLKEKCEVDIHTAEQILIDVVDISKKALQVTDHYFPCILFLHGGPDEFNIGPVIFVRRRKFFQNHKQAFRRSVAKEIAAHVAYVNRTVDQEYPRERVATPEQSTSFIRGLQARSIRIYRGYPWIAKVRVINCDHHVSQERAARVAETALHVIRIFLGASNTKRIRLAWSRGDALKSAHMWADDDGTIHVSTSSSSLAPVGFTNWYDGLTQDGGLNLQVIGSALYPLTDPQEIYHLHERFIDSISWFGDAATDLEPSASVVKYVSAIERLLFGKFTIGRKKAFATRIKQLFIAFGCDDARTYEDALKVYDGRSALLHGASSPKDKGAHHLAELAEQHARICILCAAQLYPMILNAYKDPSPSDLEDILKRVEQDGVEWLVKLHPVS